MRGFLKNRGIQIDKTSRDYRGTLKRIEEKIEPDAFGSRKKYYYFVIKGLIGEKTFVFKGQPSHNLRDYYEIGERVIHHAGYGIPVKENLKESELSICVECGELIPYGECRCVYCGKGMIRNKKRGK